jgi:hypothetical protein
MGLFSVSVSFLCDDENRIIGAYQQECDGEPAFVSRSINGWVILVSAALDTFDTAVLERTATRISETSGCPSLGVAIVDSSTFECWAFNGNGKCIAHWRIGLDGPPFTEKADQDLHTTCAMFGHLDSFDSLRESFSRTQTYADTFLSDLSREFGICGPAVSYKIVEEECGPGAFDPMSGWEDFSALYVDIDS